MFFEMDWRLEMKNREVWGKWNTRAKYALNLLTNIRGQVLSPVSRISQPKFTIDGAILKVYYITDHLLSLCFFLR